MHACLHAAEILGGEGVHARVIDCYSIKPIDTATLVAAVDATAGQIVVAEDHHPEGGLGSAVTDALLAAGRSNLAITHLAVRAMPGSGSGAVSFQLAGMRTGTSTCDPQPMLRCLIVDDSFRFLEAARGLLERQGVTVVGVASNGAETLQRARELRPDVTLLDIDLGGESGLQLAGRLHRQPGQAPAPVILISTHAEQDYAELIAASPAVGFLPKTALSGDAIRAMLAGHGDGDRGNPRP